jgi:carboxypeptidase C (cathepsin A)
MFTGTTFGEKSAEATPSKQELSDIDTLFPENPVVTDHYIELGGKKISYSAKAGFMPCYDDKGSVKAKLFYVAYTKKGVSDATKRPVTFCYNGGPGSSSIWLHMGAFGPKVVSLGDGINIPAPPYRAQTNKNTLFDITDLVFIDPVGTGFSYSIPRDNVKKFWGVGEDIKSVGQFIRMYLSDNERWASPVFVAGESYGGIRTAGLAYYLQDMGIYPRGLIFISPALTYATMMYQIGLDVPHILSLPEMATAAWYHHRIDPRLQSMSINEMLAEVRTWSSGEYAKALWKGNTLAKDEKIRIADRISDYIGLPSNLILSYNLRVPMLVFMSHLLSDRKQCMSYYDSRVTGACIDNTFADDSLVNNIEGPLVTAFNAYLGQELKFKTLTGYDTINENAEPSWDWLSGTRSDGAEDPKMGYPETASKLARALRNNKLLEVFVAIGMYDMACIHDATVYALNHLDVPEERLDNIHTHTYHGGHMMYTDPSAHKKLKSDLVTFYKKVLGTKGSK